MRNLKYWRKTAFLTQVELANAIGVAWQTVSAWEHGLQEPRPRHFRALCRVLKVTPRDLLGDPPENGDEGKAAAA